MAKPDKRERLKLPHVEIPKRPPRERIADFCEVALTYSPEQAIAEATRCVINEYAFAQEGLPLPPVAPPTGHRVAIVGSGPAGLACAEELAKQGHRVTVYDTHPRPGGLLRYGIPGFKLDKAVVDLRIEYLERLGVEFIGNTRVSQDVSLEELLDGGFHAVFLATGATAPKRSDLPGIGLDGVEDALPFLIRNEPDGVLAIQDDLRDRRVVVLGGGDTAMDCVRTAKRLGAASVACVYRRDETNMPGSRREVQSAREEGVEFQWLTAPVRFIDSGTGRVRGIECVRMALGEPDGQGRRRPMPVEGSTFEVEADLAILAFGFDGSPLPDTDGLKVTAWQTYIVGDDGMTSRRGIFAGGDAVRGPDLIVTALHDGRRAAEAIDAYLATTAGREPASPRGPRQSATAAG